MLDFTSALYLGLRHPSWRLPAWTALTLGKPAALEDPPGAAGVERKLAALTGFEEAMLGASSLHLFLDVFALLAGPGSAIFLDHGSYPIAGWGARLTGCPVRRFPRGDPAALEDLLRRAAGMRPVIVTDGVYPARGRVAPLAEYRRLAEERGGLVVVDDTQALGILGAAPQSTKPYGYAGGGSVRYLGAGARGFVVVSSLAKAFGVPVAMIGGSAPLIARLRERSLTRLHCSPPSVAAVAAAAHALEENRCSGEVLRARLARRVAEFRRGLRCFRPKTPPSLFPIQRICLPTVEAKQLHDRLLDRGVRAVPQRRGLSFFLTACHQAADIRQAIDIIAEARSGAPPFNRTGVYGYDEST